MDFGEARLQLKFGPSAWFANEQDPNWTRTVDPRVADYPHLFLTRASNREVRQSVEPFQRSLTVWKLPMRASTTRKTRPASAPLNTVDRGPSHRLLA